MEREVEHPVRTALRKVATLASAALGISIFCIATQAADLPQRYFELLDHGAARIAERLAADPAADLEKIEAQPGSRHFPSAVLVGAVLYAKQHSANPRYHDPKTLATALAVGDLLVAACARGTYQERLDHHRDTYMWLEAYRLLEAELGEPRREQWRQALIEQLNDLAADVAQRQDYPWYNSPFIITSPNHFSLWSSTLYLGAKVFQNQQWQRLAGKVLHRFAAEEQTVDGYWGEHSRAGPTTGYDYLTSAAVALYREHSGDPAALEALRRSTDFHMYFTYPDGTPVETINDRNRYWDVSMWGHFGFSNFPDGRRYAEFLTSFYDDHRLQIEALGRIAQNALYYHEGPKAPIPQDQERSFRQMSVPAGIRKTGPWVYSLSGLISTPTLSRFYLDRQSALSVFHEKLGLILSGANSKRQPELATLVEKTDGQVFHLPMSSRLQMADGLDSLALAFNRFFTRLEVPEPAAEQLEFRFVFTPKGRMAETTINLQLVLKPGTTLETEAGRRVVLGEEKIEWSAEDVGKWVRHNGWTLSSENPMRVTWPVYPFNPYADAPETGINRAVGVASVGVDPGPQTVPFVLRVE